MSLIRNLRSVLWLLPLAWLWLVLINDLRVEWTVNPEYGYGWAVPFMCLYLLGRRFQKTDDRGREAEGGGRRTEGGERRAEDGGRRAEGGGRRAEGGGRRTEGGGRRTEGGGRLSESQASGFWLQVFALALCALLYAPTRLIEEASPGWRLISWALALEVVGITLCWLRLWFLVSNPPSGFRRPFSAFVFPICFFLVAVPWPSGLETAVIQGLTRLDAAGTCELMGWLGIPAIPHGNVIEVATGQVGIDEACSGIRSFQATLMLSLFFGDLYRLPVVRRSALCLAGFAMSFGFNLVRMSILVWVAASRGVGAIARWHDPTGVTILLACFFGLWALGVWLGKKRKAPSAKRQASGASIEHSTSNIHHPSSIIRPPSSAFRLSAFSLSAFALCLWLLLVEVSVAGWFGWHEARLPRAVQWSVAWPTNNPSYQATLLPPRTREILRYDEGHSAGWAEGNLSWQVIFLSWQPGRTAVDLAENHTPAVCLAAAGHTLDTEAARQWIEVQGLRLPFQVYKLTDTSPPLFVFYCLWDDRASAQGFDTASLTRGSRLAAVLAGRRNPGERSIEIVLGGVDNVDAAVTAVRAELEKILTVKQGRAAVPPAVLNPNDHSSDCVCPVGGRPAERGLPPIRSAWKWPAGLKRVTSSGPASRCELGQLALRRHAWPTDLPTSAFRCSASDDCSVGAERRFRAISLTLQPPFLRFRLRPNRR